MEWKALGDALDGARRRGMVGDQLGCNPAVDPCLDEAISLGEFTVGSEGPAETNKGTEAFGRPGQVAARMGGRLRRRELVVIRGGLAAALPSKLPRQGAIRARAASPRLVTIDGVLVHAAARC